MAKKMKITGCTITTAGVTKDGKYSLALCEVDGEPCLCLHKCEVRDGLHYSPMNDDSLITAIGKNKILAAAELLRGPMWGGV